MPQSLAGLDEARLCRLLAAGPWRGQRMVVVCDGAAHPMRLAVSPTDAVELVLSGVHRSADDVIIELISGDSAPRLLTVVSSDRQIRKAARRRRARTITSEQFVDYLLEMLTASRRANAMPGRDHKRTTQPLNEKEVEQWLKTFGVEDSNDSPHSDCPPWGYDSQ